MPLSPEHFSSHLFWDIDPSQLDWEAHARFVIGRVLDYGTLADWQLLKSYYGLERIAAQAMHIRSLSQRSAAFIAALAHIPKQEFACYSTTPSPRQPWNS